MDLKDFGISENFDFITSKSKQAFKRLVKTKANEYALNKLLGNDLVVCPLCSLYLDSQDLSFQCPVMKKELSLDGDMAEVYKTDISK